MVMDPEVLSGGMDDPVAPSDEVILEAEEAGEGEPEPEIDPVEQQWESEPFQQRRERERIRNARKLVSLTERALDGDAEARAQLEADPVGRRALALQARIDQKVQQTAPNVAAAQRRYEELARLEQDDHYAFVEELRQTPGLGKWFYNDYPAYEAQQAQARSTPRTGTEPVLERYVDRLLARDEAKGLSAAEREELDPGNPEWDGLDPLDAQVAIAGRFALLTAKRTARERVAPEEARRQRRAAEAEAVEAAIASSPPNVSGRPAGRQDFDQIAAAYAEDPSPRNRDAYIKARAARGW